jgi:hypothetical protein
VIPSRRAACACVVSQRRTWSLIAIITFDRMVIVAAPSGLSSMASRTLAKVLGFVIRSSLHQPQSPDILAGGRNNQGIRVTGFRLSRPRGEKPEVASAGMT